MMKHSYSTAELSFEYTIHAEMIEINNVEVFPRFRKQGRLKAFLDSIQNGYKKPLYLECYGESLRDMYIHLGFVVTNTLFGNYFTLIRMTE